MGVCAWVYIQLFNSYMFTMYTFNSSYNLKNAGFLTSAFNICYINIFSTCETRYVEFQLARAGDIPSGSMEEGLWFIIILIHGSVRFAPGSLADARSGDFLEIWSKPDRHWTNTDNP